MGIRSKFILHPCASTVDCHLVRNDLGRIVTASDGEIQQHNHYVRYLARNIRAVGFDHLGNFTIHLEEHRAVGSVREYLISPTIDVVGDDVDAQFNLHGHLPNQLPPSRVHAIH